MHENKVFKIKFEDFFCKIGYSSKINDRYPYPSIRIVSVFYELTVYMYCCKNKRGHGRDFMRRRTIPGDRLFVSEREPGPPHKREDSLGSSRRGLNTLFSFLFRFKSYFLAGGLPHIINE